MKRLFFLVARFQLLLTLGLFYFFSLNEDKLLYRSDLASLVTYISGIAFLALAVSSSLGLIAWCKPGQKLYASAAAFFNNSILTLLFTLPSLIAIEHFRGPFESNSQFMGWFMGLMVGFFAWSVLALKNSLHIMATIRSLAVMSLVVSVITFPTFKTFAWMQERSIPKSQGSRPQGVVLIMVDRLGAKYLPSFNPKATANVPNFSKFADDSIVFNRFHANGSGTAETFKALWSGLQITQVPKDPKLTFLETLQKAGVTVKLIVSTNSALPDRHGFRYKGLRSVFLTQHFTALPRILGIDYHIYRYRRQAQGFFIEREGKRASFLYKLFNDKKSFKDPLKTLVDEMEYLESKNKPYFIMLHIFQDTYDFEPAEGHFGRGTGLFKKIALQTDTSGQEVADPAVEVAYRYDPEKYQWWVDLQEAEYIESLEKMDVALGQFLKEFYLRGWDKNHAIMLTSDHGSSFEDGLYQYIWHINEPVAWVPLILKLPGRKGVDNRLGETLDISATTLDLFGLEEKARKMSKSLLKPPKKNSTITFGYVSGGGNEFAVYAGNKKYYFTQGVTSKLASYQRTSLVTRFGEEIFLDQKPDPALLRIFVGKDIVSRVD